MLQTIQLQPGVTLRCFKDDRFAQNCLSLQFVREMDAAEAAMNALIPAVLLRGTKTAPDLRSITLRLDDLYGASVGALVRRVGDYQSTGFYCNFISDRYTLEGESLLCPMLQFVQELLFEPVTENGAFRTDFVESEKKNLLAAIQSQKNDKRAYAAAQLLKRMCRQDPFGVPRLGEEESIPGITPDGLYRHYQKVLAQSKVELFYVGHAPAQQVAQLLQPLVQILGSRDAVLPPQTGFRGAEEGTYTESMEVSQGKLAMGFTTPITSRDPRLAAMQLCNTILGGGMTSKLFMNIREKQSLCYDIGSGYYGSKGIVTVSAGIDFDKEALVREQVSAHLAQMVQGKITEQELTAARQSLLSHLQTTHDSPGAIEGYYANGVLSGMDWTPQEYMDQLRSVTVQQVAEAAATLQLHTVYFLKGVQ